MRISMKGVAAWAAVTVGLLLAGTPAMGEDAGRECRVSPPTRLPGQNIVTAAVAAGQFNTLASVLVSTGLDKVLTGPGPFRVFAPTDAAFEKIPASVLGAIVANEDVLKAVLTYHVTGAGGDLRYIDQIRALKTVQGERVFARTSCYNGATVLYINNSKVIARPIVVDNGTIYVIDSVLLPQF